MSEDSIFNYTLMMSLLTLVAVLAVSAVAIPVSTAVKLLYTFEDSSFLENIAVRANGHLLLTTVAGPRVYTIDPASTKPTPSVLVELNATIATGVLGITEYAPDRFAFVAGRYDRRHGQLKARHYLPHVGFANGLITLPKLPGTVMLSDSTRGALWTVNVHTGAVRRVAQVDEFLPSNPSGPAPLGINGIRTYGSDLYFVNMNLQRFCRVPIHADGRLAGNVTILATPLTELGQVSFDDFAVDYKGTAWVATPFDSLDAVLPSGKVMVAASGLNPIPQPQTAGPTSAAFGRGSKKQEPALAITSLAAPVSNVVSSIYKFDNGAFLESIETRSNGHLVFTSISQPRVYNIDPTSPNPTPIILVEFNTSVATSISGLTEYAA
ncbi:hypothetical protein BKA62DRAFT_770017 [Auriculariales sp. MPI-PUGE-AT-0066]|nr:hypothetical protein BKA62DRAFT_770017 [Auriculariales sp. MPI-PUGE-AT-0066]